jgi:hypothetical protein
MLIRDRLNGRIREVQIVWHATLEDRADTDGPQQFPDEYEFVEATDDERAELGASRVDEPEPGNDRGRGLREISLARNDREG